MSDEHDELDDTDDWYEWIEQEESEIEACVICMHDGCVEAFIKTYYGNEGDIEAKFVEAAKKNGWRLTDDGPVCKKHAKE